MADLKALLKRASGEHKSRKSAAERQVVRWEHWSGPAYDPKPFYFERALRAGVVKRGKLKVWTGAVPATPIEEAVEQSRHYTR